MLPAAGEAGCACARACPGSRRVAAATAASALRHAKRGGMEGFMARQNDRPTCQLGRKESWPGASRPRARRRFRRSNDRAGLCWWLLPTWQPDKRTALCLLLAAARRGRCPTRKRPGEVARSLLPKGTAREEPVTVRTTKRRGGRLRPRLPLLVGAATLVGLLAPRLAQA